MKKYCEDCKWNSYNMFMDEFKKANIFVKLYMLNEYINMKFIFKKYPRCNHPEVYSLDNNLVFKETSKRNIYCSVARHESSISFKTCGESGKYFEEK